MECSSKEMSGVHEIFETAIDTVVAESEGRSMPTGHQSVGMSGGQGGNAMAPPMMARKKKRSACKIL